MGGWSAAQRRGMCAAWLAVASAMFGFIEPVSAETIILVVDDPGDGIILPGTSFSVLAVLRDNTEEKHRLTGYTLNVDIAGVPSEHVGTVSASIGLTNFFVSQNLIEQDPDQSLHPIWSVIGDPGDGGVFINGFSNDFAPVDLAIEGVSDILAQIVFNVPLDALGLFEISLAGDSTLGDIDFEPVDFTSDPLEIRVVPEPLSLAFGLWALFSVTRRRGER